MGVVNVWACSSCTRAVEPPRDAPRDRSLAALPCCRAVLCAGHRSTRPTSLPLKRGMMHYGFSRKLPVQLIITRGKEDVMSEKAGTVHFGTTLATGYSQVQIRPGWSVCSLCVCVWGGGK